MSIFSKLKNRFSAKSSYQLDEWDNYLTISSSPPLESERTTKELLPPENLETKALLPKWLLDDDDLRDEGVIFGLTGAKAEEKISMIKNAFKKNSTVFEKKIELLSEQISVFNLQIAQLEETKKEASVQKDYHLSYEYQSHQLPKITTAIIFSLVGFVGAFFLVDFAIAQKVSEMHWFVSAGVFFVGLFSVYQKYSAFDSSKEHTFWRVIEWYFVPSAAALFVFICAIDDGGLLLSIGILIFTLAVFLVTGKLFFTHQHQWSAEWRKWRENRNNELFLNTKMEKVNEQIQSINDKVGELRAEKWKINPELTQAESEMNKLNSERDVKIQLFQSEYELASSVKDKLSPQLIKKIVS